VRWLRPDYPAPDAAAPVQDEAELAQQPAAAAATQAVAAAKAVWPRAMRDPVGAVRHHLAQQPHTTACLARQFKRQPHAKVAAVLDALESLGHVESDEATYPLPG